MFNPVPFMFELSAASVSFSVTSRHIARTVDDACRSCNRHSGKERSVIGPESSSIAVIEFAQPGEPLFFGTHVCQSKRRPHLGIFEQELLEPSFGGLLLLAVDHYSAVGNRGSVAQRKSAQFAAAKSPRGSRDSAAKSRQSNGIQHFARCPSHSSCEMTMADRRR